MSKKPSKTKTILPTIIGISLLALALFLIWTAIPALSWFFSYSSINSWYSWDNEMLANFFIHYGSILVFVVLGAYIGILLITRRRIHNVLYYLTVASIAVFTINNSFMFFANRICESTIALDGGSNCSAASIGSELLWVYMFNFVVYLSIAVVVFLLARHSAKRK